MIVLFFCVVVLRRLLASLPAGKVFLDTALGAAGGGGVGLDYLNMTLAANGGSWDYSPTKVRTLKTKQQLGWYVQKHWPEGDA